MEDFYALTEREEKLKPEWWLIKMEYIKELCQFSVCK